MDKLIEQARGIGNFKLSLYLQYLDYVMDTMIELEEMRELKK